MNRNYRDAVQDVLDQLDRAVEQVLPLSGPQAADFAALRTPLVSLRYEPPLDQ